MRSPTPQIMSINDFSSSEDLHNHIQDTLVYLGVCTLSKFQKVNVEFIFENWKKTFNTNYKEKEEFKQLVVYEENIKLMEIESAARALIVENEISIFCKDPGDFKNYKIKILKKEKFKSYNSEQKDRFSGK